MGNTIINRLFFMDDLRWPASIYMRVVMFFQLPFSAGTIKPISMSFGILNNVWWNFKYKIVRDIGIYLKPHFFKKC